MGEISASKYVVQAGWSSVPHLDEKTKRELLASTPPTVPLYCLWLNSAPLIP